MKDVLAAGGVQSGVVYTAHVGADAHLSGKPDKLPISRGVPIAKAMLPHAIDWNPKGYLNNTMHRVAVRVA